MSQLNVDGLAGQSSTDIEVSSGNTLKVDTIAETTLNGGVTVDGVLIKDSKINHSYIEGLTGQTFMIQGERNSTSTVGDHYSHGNGSADAQLMLPYNCEAIAMSFHSNNDSGAVEIYKNNAATSTDYRITASTGYSVFTTPLSFSAGDTIHVQATTAASTSSVSTVVLSYT
jgi:hypothetical protein